MVPLRVGSEFSPARKFNPAAKENLEDTLKTRISLFVIILALAASFTMSAHASACSNASIRGTYATTIRGQILLPNGASVLLTGVAMTTYDGFGNFTQVDAVADNGNLQPGWRPGSGTYSVNPDCTGTQTIVIPGMPDLHLQFVVSQSGNTIRSVVVDPGIATTAEGERVRALKP